MNTTGFAAIILPIQLSKLTEDDTVCSELHIQNMAVAALFQQND